MRCQDASSNVVRTLWQRIGPGIQIARQRIGRAYTARAAALRIGRANSSRGSASGGRTARPRVKTDKHQAFVVVVIVVVVVATSRAARSPML